MEKIHAGMVALAQEHRVVTGRRMRLHTTVVDANIPSRPTVACWEMGSG